MKYKISDIAEINKKNINKNYKGKVFYLDTSSVTNDFFNCPKIYTSLKEAPIRARRLAEDGDTIISTVRPAMRHVGYISQNLNRVYSTGFAIISPKKSKVNPFYLYLVLSSKEITNLLQSIAVGSTSAYPSIKPRDIGNLTFDFPSLCIQEKIASIMQQIILKIKMNNQINANLAEIGNTIFREILSSNKLNELTINDIGTVAGGGTPSKKNSSYWNGDIPWLSPKDLSNNPSIFTSSGENYITQQGLDNSSTKLLPKNTVLFSSRAPIGYISIAKNRIATNQGFKSVIPNKQYPFWFIYELLKLETPKIINEANGSTFKEISGSRLKQHIVYVPKSSDILKYNLTFTSLFQKIMQTESEINTLNTLKRTLLNKLF